MGKFAYYERTVSLYLLTDPVYTSPARRKHTVVIIGSLAIRFRTREYRTSTKFTLRSMVSFVRRTTRDDIDVATFV